MKRTSYPLQWPESWKRTTWRKAPKFSAHFSQDRDSVIRQLNRRGGSHVVITSDLPTRNDGLPYANATCNDPGIAVYWVEKGTEHVIACDRWKRVQDNLRAIEMSLAAMRALDRWGASEMVERAFAGFAALPAARSGRGWRELFDIGPIEERTVDRFQLFAMLKDRHRKLIMSAHPDRGGSHELAAELNAALAEAEQELTQ